MPIFAVNTYDEKGANKNMYRVAGFDALFAILKNSLVNDGEVVKIKRISSEYKFKEDKGVKKNEPRYPHRGRAAKKRVINVDGDA